ncbi:hypothetical protein GCM10027168_04620 [Streptomyces capparidis]
MARCCLAAAVALAAVGAGPARAADGGDVPAYRTAGEPVKGTTSSASAPLLTPGIHTDTIGRGEKKYYSVALDDVSNAFLSAFALPAPDRPVTYADGIDLELASVDGTSCSTTDRTFGGDGAARPLGDYVSRLIDPDWQCQEKDTYLLSVERPADTSSTDTGRWPLELSFMVEPGLREGEQPPAPSPGASEPPAAAAGTPKKVAGGTGFNDAPAVGAGVWQDRLTPGQTTFYQVPVEWGQQVFADAQFANAERLTDPGGYAAQGIRMELYNPARGLVVSENGMYRGEPAAVELGTAPAAYANRGDDDADTATRQMRFSGPYYLAVSLHRDVEAFTDGGVAVNLRVRLAGKPVDRPRYEGDAGAFGVTEADRSAAERGAVPEDGGDGSGGRTLIAAAGFGTGTALLLGLGAWTLLARRRPGPGAPLSP